VAFVRPALSRREHAHKGAASCGEFIAILAPFGGFVVARGESEASNQAVLRALLEERGAKVT